MPKITKRVCPYTHRFQAISEDMSVVASNSYKANNKLYWTRLRLIS